MSVDWGTLNHHNFSIALDQTFQAAVAAEPGDCILITGPTGVGKTTILASVLDMLVGPPHSWPNGELHYISIECDRETPGAITRNIAVDLNRALGNPFVSLPLASSDQDRPFSPIRARINEHDLRESFRLQAAHLRTRYLGLDAMENIAPRQETSAETRFDSIKSLVRPHKRHEKAHEMTLIMAGHYSLLMYWKANAQLARRVTEIPVPPYRETAQDIDRFEELLHLASRLYPLKKGQSLRDWNDVLFQLSLGCVGLLRKLLNDAVIQMHCRNGLALDLSDIANAAPPDFKLDNVKRDLENFWPYFDKSGAREILAKARARERLHAGVSTTSAYPRKGRIGRKAARRDPVGK